MREVTGLRKLIYTYLRQETRALYLATDNSDMGLSTHAGTMHATQSIRLIEQAGAVTDDMAALSCTVSLCTWPRDQTVLSGPKKGFARQEDLRPVGDLPAGA